MPDIKKSKHRITTNRAKAHQMLQTDAKAFSQRTGRPPHEITRQFLRQHGNTRETHYTPFYDTYKQFVEAVFPVSERPTAPTDEEDAPKFNRDAISATTKIASSKKSKRYIVTSAVGGQSLHQDFYSAIKNYCQFNKAERLILAMRGVHKKDDIYPDELLSEAHFFCREFQFNSNLIAFDAELHPQQLIPLTGMRRIGQKNYSVIVAHTKQQLTVAPVGGNALPHIVASTGVITNPDGYACNRIGKLATEDHLLGALVVEIMDDNIFHIRQIQYKPESKGFYDLDYFYPAKGNPEKASAHAIYAGDAHSGWLCESARSALFQKIALLNPKHIFVGDFFDGTSISHHHIQDTFAQLERPIHLISLDAELTAMGQELRYWIDRIPKTTQINLIEGNHDNVLHRYLTEGRYINDRANYRLALELAMYICDHKNPFQEYFAARSKQFPGVAEKITWLNRESSYKIAGCELAKHGDKGGNGGYGSSRSLEDGLGNAIVGHSHTPEIFRNIAKVGTLSRFDLPYTKSSVASSWLHADCSIYDNGQKQLLISIHGNFRL